MVALVRLCSCPVAAAAAVAASAASHWPAGRLLPSPHPSARSTPPLATTARYTCSPVPVIRDRVSNPNRQSDPAFLLNSDKIRFVAAEETSPSGRVQYTRAQQYHHRRRPSLSCGAAAAVANTRRKDANRRRDPRKSVVFLRDLERRRRDVFARVSSTVSNLACRPEQIIKKKTMADLSMKESPCYKNSLVTTSTPYKSINDSGYNTPSSNISSNLSQISEVSISFDHTQSDIDSLQLSSPTHDFTIHKNDRKLEDITNKVESPTKKLKLCSNLQLDFHLHGPSNNDDSQFLKRKKHSPPKNVNRERISIEGREKVDLMYFLSERYHFQPVIEKILSFLSGSDIMSMCMVSKIWCTAIENSPIAQKKKQKYFKLSKENRCGYVGRDRSAFNNKGCLANISNVMRSPSKRELPQRSPPVSPSKYRFHVFQKEAKKLSSDQQLVPCPRCSRPASWSPSQSTRAECKGFHCKFIFCTECKCEYSNKFEHKCLSMPILSMSSYNCRPMVYNLSKRKHNLRRL